MLVVIYDPVNNCNYMYVARFGDNLYLGLQNRLGDVIIGLYLLDEIDNIITAYRNAFFAELYYRIKYHQRKDEERRNS